MLETGTEIKLLSLEIRRFKGCRALDLELGGSSATVYGDNATGKTTIYDALTWLLFGKDSRGRGDFEIKPLGQDGQVEDHGAVSSVSARFAAGGGEIALKKTYYEKWSTKRGSAEASYDGNTSEYFVDEVPVKKYEFERRVGELVSEDLFRMLTNVSWFCEGMDWKARRKILFEVCGIPEDREILEEEPRFAQLAEAVGNLSLDDYKKKLSAQRKGLNGARNTIPARMDEQQQVIDGLSALDFDGLRARREELNSQADQLSGELVKLDHGALLDSRRNELAALKNQLTKLDNDNSAYRAKQIVPVQDLRPQLERQLEQTRRDVSDLADRVHLAEENIRRTEQLVEACRAEWKEADGETFAGGTCPTCGQALPPEQLAQTRSRFEADKERRKQQAISRSQAYKQTLEQARTSRERYIEQAVQAENEAARLTDELAACVPQAPAPAADMPGYQEEAERLREAIQAAEREVSRLSGESAAIRTEIQGKVVELRREIQEVDRELGKAGALSHARARLEELRAEARETARALEAIDQQIFLCEEFARYKVQFIEEGVNRKFRLARFRLFQEQVNGGLADCCEPTYDGVPYGSLNNGMRINLGVDVIRTISEHYGLKVPLVVDNAESVTRLAGIDTQVIRLVVSEADKVLRVEVSESWD